MLQSSQTIIQCSWTWTRHPHHILDEGVPRVGHIPHEPVLEGQPLLGLCVPAGRDVQRFCGGLKRGHGPALRPHPQQTNGLLPSPPQTLSMLRASLTSCGRMRGVCKWVILPDSLARLCPEHEGHLTLMQQTLATIVLCLRNLGSNLAAREHALSRAQ